MKGLILAGGSGSRLYPMTQAASKQLQPVYDKPMIYYPLTTLIECGVRDICIITTPEDASRFAAFLGTGDRFGVNFHYLVQPEPKGIAQALLIAEDWIDGAQTALILGDNVFNSSLEIRRAAHDFKSSSIGASIFAYAVENPSRYGVVEVGYNRSVLTLEEKPEFPKSNYAVPGLYFLDRQASFRAKKLRPSRRGELEIVDMLNTYQKDHALVATVLSRSVAWTDAGTVDSLSRASNFVQSVEMMQGIKMGCPEEAAYRQGFLTLDQLKYEVAHMPNCTYRDYLTKIVKEE